MAKKKKKNKAVHRVPARRKTSRRRKPVTVVLKRPARSAASGFFGAKKPQPAPAPPPPDLPPVSGRRHLEERLELSLDHPRVSVVLVNHDGVDALWHCLFALKTQTRPPDEIILVDNASQDASVPFVKANYPQVRILECQENFGPAMGWNLGVKTATGDLVALAKSDAVFTPDWLSRMTADFREGWPGVGVLTATRGTRGGGGEGRPGFSTLNILGLPVPGFFADSRTVFHPDELCFLYARYLAPEGPFDPDLSGGAEGPYLGWRFRHLRKGVRRSAAKVFRAEEPEGTPEWKGIYYRTRNRWLYAFCFLEPANLARILPWMAAESLVRLVKSLGTGLDSSFGNFLALAWLLAHPRTLLRKRREIQARRKASDGEVLRFLSGRVAGDGGSLARLLNFLSLSYCALVGLEVMEYQENA